MKAKNIIIIFFILPIYFYCQSTELKGKIKYTREKVIFLNDSIQNFKLFKIDGDYGHSGFNSPKGTIFRFYKNWYNELFVHYINNKRNYNEKGLLISEDWFYKNDKKFVTYEYKYTDFDSLCTIIEKNIYDNNNQTTYNTYTYNNNIQSSLTYWSNESANFNLHLYSYNDDSKLEKEQRIEKNGISSEKYYLYNKDKQINKIIVHKPNIFKWIDNNSYHEVKDSIGRYYTSEIRIYNTKKQLIEKQFFSEQSINSKNELKSKIFYKYDESENCIEERRIYNNSDVVRVHNKAFDFKKRLLNHSLTTLNYNSPYDYKKEFVYNDEDKLVKLIISYKESKHIVEFKYKYDKHKNWVEQIKFVDGKKLFVWKRKIKYYK